MKTIFLKISNTEIDFSESDSIRIEDTNIPHEKLRFNWKNQPTRPPLAKANGPLEARND